ncbi:MAG: DUF1919 domain-containing protein [Desulfovibrionaceae bacterium]|nr:DUF1919 domain-containing protein [Desulfovibrionaceae bacterium]
MYTHHALQALVKLYNGINILGYASFNNLQYDISMYGKRLKFIPEENLQFMNYNLIILCGNNYDFINITKRLSQFNIDVNKIFTDKVIAIPNFTFAKYSKLINSQLTIFSRNCFAGILYNTFNMRFLTPFINMFFEEDDFLSFLHNPTIVNGEINLIGTSVDEILKTEYPIGQIDNIKLFFNHYKNFTKAKNIFYERRKRINWFNLLVVTYTDSESKLKEFDNLPYAKKVCFTSFPSNLDSAYYLETYQEKPLELWDRCNHVAAGRLQKYDYFDMLLYGKKTLLS